MKGRCGLDIGSSNVRIVELADKAKSPKLLGFGMESIEDGERAGLIDAIKKVVKKASISTKNVNTSVSGQSVIVRYIQFPKMTEEELASSIRFEAEKYIPFSIADMIIDYEILGEAAENKMDVLLVAAKSKFIKDHLQIIKEADLEPVLIDVDSFAIMNSLKVNYPDQSSGTVGLLNVGAKFTNIHILKDGRSCFARDIQIAGEDITKLICEKLNLKFRDAEELKCNPGERLGELSEIIKPGVEDFLGEVRLSFDYYESQFGRGIDRVFLSGGSARLRGLAGSLKEGLRLEVEVLDPLKSFSIGADIDRKRLAELSPGLTVCLGLALRKV